MSRRSKKQRAKSAKRRTKPKLQPKPLSGQRSSPQKNSQKRWGSRLWKLFLFALALATTVALIDQFWGPVWPTHPEIKPGAPSYSPAFLVPFEVKNRSLLFEIKNANFRCVFDEVRTDGFISIIDIAYLSAKDVNVGTNETRPFTCKFEKLLSQPKVIEAKIRIRVDYSVGVSKFLLNRTLEVGPYIWQGHLKPPQWIEGEPIR